MSLTKATKATDKTLFPLPKKLLIPWQKATLYQVGCGGTGSYLAMLLAKAIALIVETTDKSIEYYLIDPDKVEPRNTFRQNFTSKQVGSYKIVATALDIAHLVTPVLLNAEFAAVIGAINLPSNYKEELTIIIGAVDNALTRQQIHSFCSTHARPRLLWLDCGNSLDAGQVLIGNQNDNQTRATDLGVSGIPFPSIQEPGLLLEEDKNNLADQLPCPQLQLLGRQHFLINNLVAVQAAAMIWDLLNLNLNRRACYFNLQGAVENKML